jgi:hypothetical protein
LLTPHSRINPRRCSCSKHVDAVQAQPAQAALAGRQHAALVGMLRQQLADDETIGARQPVGLRLAQRLADHLLGPAVAVHLGGVDDAPAVVQRAPHGGHFGRAAVRVFAQAPRAQPQRRPLFAAAFAPAVSRRR